MYTIRYLWIDPVQDRRRWEKSSGEGPFEFGRWRRDWPQFIETRSPGFDAIRGTAATPPRTISSPTLAGTTRRP